MHVFSRHTVTYLQIPAQWVAALMSLCATMCMYFARNTCTYLHWFVSLCSSIFYENTCTYLQIPTVGMCRYLTVFFSGFCAGFCAVASPPARLHRRRIAIALPHRIGAASRRCTKRRRLADFIRITFASGAADPLHAEEVEPQQRALGEATMRSIMRALVEVMVERL